MTKADDVPEWAWERMESLTLLEGGAKYRHAFARYIAAHEPAPVDPLREFLANVPDEEIRRIADSKDVLTCRCRIEDMLRARSVTFDTGGEGA